MPHLLIFIYFIWWWYEHFYTNAQEELSMDHSILLLNNPARKLHLAVLIEQPLLVSYFLSHPSYFNSNSLPELSFHILEHELEFLTSYWNPVTTQENPPPPADFNILHSFT